MPTDTWDYVVVGAGSGGATLAARLSENPQHRVLLLEAGPRDFSPYIHIPGFVQQAFQSPGLGWHYLGEPDPSVNGRQFMWEAGRVLGGSSSVNGMICGRGLPYDYDSWAAAGNPGWGWADMLPYFRRLETWTGTPHPARGTNGPVQVRLYDEPHPACTAVMDAFVAGGVPRVEDYCIGITEGIGVTQATQRGGWRHSAAVAYLNPARGRPNLKILTHSQALKLELANGRCTGVTFERQGRINTVNAEREVIVCSGTFGTPKLLLLSGIGAADTLRGHGIAVAHDLPGVGRNLNEHVNIKLSAHVAVRTFNSMKFGPRRALHGLRWLLDRRGPAATPANHCQGFLKTNPGLPSADIQIQMMAVGFNEDPNDRTDGITAVVSLCHPEVRGTVGLRSADPKDPPRIDIQMLNSDPDIAGLLAGVKIAREALRAGSAKFNGKVFAPAPVAPTDQEWVAFFRKYAGLNWHPTSTCRMGHGELDVVGADLRVHGLEGLSIADASIMPTVISANTNVPVIAIAEKAADLIAARAQ